MNRVESIAVVLRRHDWSVKIVVNSTRQYLPLLVSGQAVANAWFRLHLQGRWLYGQPMKSLFFAISLAIGLAACGGKDEPKTPDAPVVVIDAPKAVDAPPAGPNVLGKRCGQTAGGYGPRQSNGRLLQPTLHGHGYQMLGWLHRPRWRDAAMRTRPSRRPRRAVRDPLYNGYPVSNRP
jgi:hypothetical protein